jgi:hypothetical protein
VKKRFFPLPRNDLPVPLHLSQIEPDYLDFIGIAVPAVVGLILLSMPAQHCGGNGKLQSRTDDQWLGRMTFSGIGLISDGYRRHCKVIMVCAGGCTFSLVEKQ